jgi:hypothetical protein
MKTPTATAVKRVTARVGKCAHIPPGRLENRATAVSRTKRTIETATRVAAVWKTESSMASPERSAAMQI